MNIHERLKVAQDRVNARIADSTEDSVRRAQNLLVNKGAQFVEQALAANPDGPVLMETDISKVNVHYAVIIGDPGDSMSSTGGARVIWSREVVFGADDAHCAGGRAFVEAAREQEAIAWAALELLEACRG